VKEKTMDADWVTEGAHVAEYHWRSYEPTVTLTTAERLTATQIVLANGHRYRRDTLRPVGNHHGGSELLSAGEPRVRDALARAQLRSVSNKVGNLMRNHKGGVDAVLATLNEITEAVEAARSAITRLT
jgi:hypothetical protein